MLLFEATLPPGITWYALEQGNLTTGNLTISANLTEQINQLPRFDHVRMFGYVLPHGGEHFREAATRLDDSNIGILEASASGSSANRAIVATAQAAFRLRPQAAHLVLSDTALFQHLPAMAAQYPLPAELRDLGLRRYGGQGLFHEWAWEQAAAQIPNLHRLISIYLGDNPNVAALCNGSPVETSDGFRASESLSGSRYVGDLDPSVVLLMREIGKTPAQIEQLLTQASGWSAIAGRPTSFFQLITEVDQQTVFARALFQHQLVKILGTALASLDGTDAFFFGCERPLEAVPFVQSISRQFQFAGLHLADTPQPQAGYVALTTSSSQIRVCIQTYNRPLALAHLVAVSLGI